MGTLETALFGSLLAVIIVFSRFFLRWLESRSIVGRIERFVEEHTILRYGWPLIVGLLAAAAIYLFMLHEDSFQ